MDDLNRKRLEKGKPLSYYGKSEDEVTDMLTEACKAHGFNGRTYTGPQENPVGRYRLSRWLPFGEHHQYEAPTEVAKLTGYELVATQRDGDWFLLYFDAEQDRGGCLRRVDIWDGQVQGICRSDVLDGALVDPLSEFTKVEGQRLVRVEAFRSGQLVMGFGTDEVELEWNSPLDADSEPEGRVWYEEGKANFERVLVARSE